MVAGRSRMRAGCPHAVSGRPILIHTCHAMPMPRVPCRGLEKLLSERHGCGIAMAQHGHGMACVNQTQLHCVNQMGKTQSKPLVAWHGREMAWERCGMCELAFRMSLCAAFLIY
jgi:hypothetical protein